MPAQKQKSGKRQEQKARTQEAILAAARDLFHRHGYELVTVRQIAKAAGVSTGALFASWAGKPGVFEAAMGHPAPDPVRFLERLSDFALTADPAGRDFVALQKLATEGIHLRNALIGHHG